MPPSHIWYPCTPVYFRVISSQNDYEECRSFRTLLAGGAVGDWAGSATSQTSALDQMKVNSQDIFAYFTLQVQKDIFSHFTLLQLVLLDIFAYFRLQVWQDIFAYFTLQVRPCECVARTYNQVA